MCERDTYNSQLNKTGTCHSNTEMLCWYNNRRNISEIFSLYILRVIYKFVGEIEDMVYWNLLKTV